MLASIFLDFRLPNSASWFYFSFVLAVALFFQFNRFFALRNWDLLAIFLFTPGFLLIQEANLLTEASATPADPEMVMAKMYSELGDPPLLLGAEFLYLPKVEQLFSLLQIEATRLQSTGDPVFNRLGTVLHLPCITLPGLRGSNGMPVGIQLIGPFSGDAMTLRAAHWAQPVLLR